MKLGAAIPVLNEWRFVPAVAGQLLSLVDRLVIVRPTVSQSGAPVRLSPIPDLDPRIDVLEGNWPTEAATRNAGMEYLSDCDYVFLVDSDELIFDEDLKELGRLCGSGDHSVIAVRLYTYWKTAGHVIDPPESGTIKMVLRKDVRISGIRDVIGPVHTADVYCHHLSYVRTDQEVLEKIRLSGHAQEIRPEWYERVWKAWDGNPHLQNLHPVHPEAYRRATPVADDRVKALLGKWGCS
jgi:glycosyltransferase involved in cell wall biosynthesis